MHRLLRDFAYYGRVAKELIFPRRCAVCATNIDNGYICEQCRRGISAAASVALLSARGISGGTGSTVAD